MSKPFSTEILAQYPHNHARVTRVSTAHGEFLTPSFMPVGTRAGVNCMMPQELIDGGSQIILGGNTYHMLVAPGMEVIQHCGGMHPFMGWSGPMLTDSGGFQVFSLSKNSEICSIDEDGARFKHPQSGEVIILNPHTSIDTQKTIGADIIMAFDQCTPNVDDNDIVVQAMQRTERWLSASRERHAQSPNSVYGYPQALFGIIQGGALRHYREQCAQFVVDLDFDGIAVGGETIGFDMAKTCEVVDWVRPILPPEKTRYTMGVGLSPQDLFDVVAHGIDIFDCVAPTRNARHGSLYSGEIVEVDHWFRFDSEFPQGRLAIKKAQFADDERPLMASCDCYTCKHYTRAYLHHLFKNQSLLYSNLACIHNIRVMQWVCERMRERIKVIGNS